MFSLIFFGMLGGFAGAILQNAGVTEPYLYFLLGSATSTLAIVFSRK